MEVFGIDTRFHDLGPLDLDTHVGNLVGSALRNREEVFALVEQRNGTFHQVHVQCHREKSLAENGLAEKVHHHVEALDLRVARREERNLVQVFHDEVVFVLVLAGITVRRVVEQELVARADGAHAVDNFFGGEALHAMRKDGHLVVASVDALEKFMEIQFGTARFRVLDVSPIDEQNLFLVSHDKTYSISACNIQK